MLIKYFIILIVVLCSFSLVAQNRKLIPKKEIEESIFRPTDRITALTDIEDGKIFLYIKGGLGVKYKPFDKQDSIFQNTYNITYFPTGCLRIDGDDYKSYNRTILDYLKKEKGLKNKRMVHSDVIGK